MKHLTGLPLIILSLFLLWPAIWLYAEIQPVSPKTGAGQQPNLASSCLRCHTSIRLDANHLFACSRCHGGDAQATEQSSAHQGLIVRPSHPSFMQQTCGQCHPQRVQSAHQSLHFTLKNKVNVIRHHFGAKVSLAQALEIPEQESPTTPLGLADDMLRRRCLRCHPYSNGDSYSAVTHGTGCASCHLPWQDGKMADHVFQRPNDRQCLSCHYSNHVGWDYYGRYEHDFNWEYRTPYTLQTNSYYPPRPYGLEYHDLAPDIHQQAGLICIDCHRQPGHEQKGAKLRCTSCHGWQPGGKPSLSNLLVVDGSLQLLGAKDGVKHTVPLLRHPAHQKYGKEVACQVCHGQWSFNDAPTHLLRTEEIDYDLWEWLSAQGSSAVEQLIDYNAYADEELPLTMPDGLTGSSRPGLWLKGYGQRRWEQLRIRRDQDGIIKVFRPILDLRLSMKDAEDEVVFDNVHGKGNGELPYMPHTTGHAGMLYLDRFQDLLVPTGEQAQ